MHFLTHYPRLLLENGPLVNAWAMPLERRNKELKEVADATKCNKNLPLAIAINDQLNSCYMKEFCQGVQTDYEKGYVLSSEIECESRTYFAGVAGGDCIQKLSHVQILGKEFSEKTLFLADITDSGEPYFGEILGVFDVSGEVYTLTSMLQTSYFDDHRHAYKMSGKVLEKRVIHIDDVPRIDPLLRVKCDDGFYLSCRYGFE
ncbi:hypothetical protein QAD02_018148 [Eretmocerus hayati]|uniref:Uncharacterized protein n=1 Tax=Eretmocerus hayati TaxID=131215 RepID=A0ACC2PFU9_9HYME|nr:hypothetical protein QAD02_018148 [Eretmocerus hayati]